MSYQRISYKTLGWISIAMLLLILGKAEGEETPPEGQDLESLKGPTKNYPSAFEQTIGELLRLNHEELLIKLDKIDSRFDRLEPTVNKIMNWMNRRVKPNYLGCYTDSKDRILMGHIESSNAMTPDFCIAKCTQLGYVYAGVEAVGWCLCGDELPIKMKTSEESCKSKCVGNGNLICGGPWLMNVYETGLTRRVKPNYLGCYTDSKDRILMGHIESSNAMTPDFCIAICTQLGYVYAGVEAGNWCLCGDELPIKMKTSEESCKSKCVGNGNLICGGPWLMNVYETGLTRLGQL